MLFFSITCIASGATSELITSGQSVTLQAPSGDYIYQWSAEVDGSTIAQGSSQTFAFTAPVIPNGTDKKTVTVFMLIRSIEGGCVNQTTVSLDVYGLPACGISGPVNPSPESKATYKYSGGSTGDLKYEWSVDGTKLSDTGDSVTVDWSAHPGQGHTVGLKLTRDYGKEVPGATNPTRTIECTYPVSLTSHPSITLSKKASASTAVVGDSVTYTYNVTNTGDVTLSGLRLSDDKLGDIALPVNSLEPGKSTVVTANYIVKSSDLPGPLTNTAAARGTDSQGEEAGPSTASASVALSYNASLNLTKTASKASASTGDSVTYTYTVKNTGDVVLHAIQASDDKLNTVNFPRNSLNPGESMSATVTYVVRSSDLPGPLVNTATANALDIEDKTVISKPVSASVALTVPVASLNLTKTASASSAKVGDTITYTYTVKNTGTLTISALQVNDDKLNTINFARNSLAPGESITATASYVVKSSDLPGPLVNTATTVARDPSGNLITPAKVSVSVTLVAPVASLNITKTASASSAKVGDTITYTYTVKNTGTLTISALQVNDDKLNTINFARNSLAPGESITATINYVVKSSDLPGPLVNTATTVARDPSGNLITPAKASASVALTYNAAIVLTKAPSATIAKVGDRVTYTYTVKNTGDVSVSNLVLSDDKLGSITISPTSLSPGQTATGTASHTVVEADLPGPLVNNATAKGVDTSSNPVTNETRASVDLASEPGCIIDGSSTLCQEKKEVYISSASEDSRYTYIYSWKVDGSITGTGKSLVLDGSDYSLGTHALELTVSRSYQGRSVGDKTCSKEIKVISTPSAEFTMRVV